MRIALGRAERWQGNGGAQAFVFLFFFIFLIFLIFTLENATVAHIHTYTHTYRRGLETARDSHPHLETAQGIPARARPSQEEASRAGPSTDFFHLRVLGLISAEH